MKEFLLCENPMDPDSLFVLKTTEPRCLVECDFLNDDNQESLELESSIDFYEIFSYINSDGDVESWILSISQFYDAIPESEDHKNKILSSVVNKVWQWFQDYLKWDEKKVNDAEHDDYLGSVN